ncbi:hypothetical protein ASF16_04855 [Acidovorax sp. Leaf78]|nr:hypothetical protein ASF16_04855 [Acidovorax sp. Leaf78]
MAQAAADIETLQAGLKAVSGSAEQAGKDMEFVRRMASVAGVDVVETGRAFLSLSAATKGTAVEGAATRQVFEAVTVAMARAGKGSAETSNALQALAQMAGKGQVQMEELRGQLGEALPGALNAAAAGLGVTTKELSELVEQGKITAEDLFPALAKGLNDLYGSTGGAQTLAQEFANVKNAFTDMASSIGDAGGLSALKTGAEIAQAGLVLLDHTVVSLGKSIGILIAAVANWDFSGLQQSFADLEAEGRDKLLKAASHNETLRAALNQTSDAALKMALAQQQAGDAASQAGAKAGASADSWIKLNVGYGQVLVSLRDQIAAAEKAVAAREAEGKASVALAAAFGTEAEKRAAQAAAAEAEAVALDNLSQLRQTELATMQAQLAALKQEAVEKGKISNERSKELAELEKQIALRQQDTDKAVAQAQAARLVAEQSKAQAEALSDNSARVAELGAAWASARAELNSMVVAQAGGMASLKQVEQAELAAGRAALLYRDALSDQLKAIKAKADAQRASLDLEAASVQLAMAQQRAVYELARARGDEAGAIRAANELRKLEIQLAELSARAKRAEGEAALAAVAAKRAELIASGQLTDVKRLELDAAEKSAQVKIKEAQIAEATAKGLKDLADVHRSLGFEAGRAVSGLESVTSALGRQRVALADQSDAMAEMLMRFTMTANMSERQIALIERETAAIERQNEARNKRLNIDKEGYSLNTAGERVLAGETKENVDKDIAERYGKDNVDNPDAQRARQLATMLKLMAQIGGNVSDQGSSNEIAAMRRELQELEARLLNGVGGSSSTSSSSSRPAAPTTATTSSSGSSGRGGGSGMSTGITINVYPGADLSNRADAERMARQLIPVIENLNRRGMRS